MEVRYTAMVPYYRTLETVGKTYVCLATADHLLNLKLVTASEIIASSRIGNNM